MITIHNLNNSRSIRMIWLMEELGLDYEIKQYKRNKTTGLADTDYRNLHPLGKSPIITDGEEPLVESGAIVDTILERYGNGKLQPKPGSADWVSYRYWMHAVEGSLMPLLVLKLVLNRMETKSPFFIRPLMSVVTSKVNGAYVTPSLEGFFNYMNATLSRSPWLTGEDFTAADIMMGYPIEAANARGGLGANYPNIEAYVQRIQSREAYKRALDKNGPMEPLI